MVFKWSKNKPGKISKKKNKIWDLMQQIKTC